MFGSPPAARTRGRETERKTHCSLPLDSDPVDKQRRHASAMAPPTTATVNKLDVRLIEDCVKKCISNDSIVDVLVNKLTHHITQAIQEAIDASLKPLASEVNKLKTQVTKLTEQVKLLDGQVQSKTDDLQQYQRRNNIRVFGVPETRGEDTDQLIIKMCKEKLNLDLPVTAICRSHRLGANPPLDRNGRPRHRPIIVKFVSYRDRRAVFAQKKKLKGSGFVIREDLTASRLEVFRRAAAIHGGQNTWTMDGRVMWISEDGSRGTATRLEDLPVSDTSDN